LSAGARDAGRTEAAEEPSLASWIKRNRSCNSEADFRGSLNNFFIEETQAIIESRDEQWLVVRDELSAAVLEIYHCARSPKRKKGRCSFPASKASGLTIHSTGARTALIFICRTGTCWRCVPHVLPSSAGMD
jgi:hypothetical protein